MLGAGGAAPGAMTFVTPAVTEGMLGGAGAGAGGAAGGGLLGGESATAGMSSLDAIAASQPGYTAAQGEAAMNAVAASQPGYVADGSALANLKTGSTYGSAARGAANYSRMNQAMGGGQQQRPAPQGQPLFQGEQPSIAGGMGAPAQNNNAVLAAIARRRQRGF